MIKIKFISTVFLAYFYNIALGQGNFRGSSDFEYAECTCIKGSGINLKIYNGLYGTFGGNLVLEIDKLTKGAVTVANLNDTDSDDIIDSLDTNVTQSTHGTNEIDLMRLDIDLVGSVSKKCTQIELKTNGYIKLWQDNSKSVRLVSNLIPVSSLPMTLYVEAVGVSKTIRDISITAWALGKQIDEVKATAIWVKYKQKLINRVNIPTPVNLGIDELRTLTSINDNQAVDNSYFGFGSFARFNSALNFLMSPTSNDNCLTDIYQNKDAAVGGRIVLEFVLLPPNIETELNNLNIKYDVTRQISNEVYNIDYGKNSNWFLKGVRDSMPKIDELANDDAVAGKDNEDVMPKDSSLFSFDTPAHHYFRGTYFNTRNAAFVKRIFRAKEFVRVGFGQSPEANTIEGSRCSQKADWGLDYVLQSEVVANAPQEGRYHSCRHYFKVVNSQFTAACPRASEINTNFINQNNGPSTQVNVVALPGLNSNKIYSWFYRETSQKWVLLDATITSNSPVLVGEFDEIKNAAGQGIGQWILEDNNRVRINISDNPATSNEKKIKILY